MWEKTTSSILVTALLVAPTAGFADEQRCSREAEECVRQMTEKLEKRGWIGIEMEEHERGRVITAVVPGSPAERAGIAPGDLMVAFNGVALTEGKEAVYEEMNRSMKPGREVTISVERKSGRHDLVVELAEIPRELLAQWIGQHMLAGHSGPEEPESADGGSQEESPGD